MVYNRKYHLSDCPARQDGICDCGIVPLVAEGERVRLIHFDTEHSAYDDNAHVPAGTEGTVIGIDDAGTIQVKWDNGSTLGLVRKWDQWERA